jgi:hypothetical protein
MGRIACGALNVGRSGLQNWTFYGGPRLYREKSVTDRTFRVTLNYKNPQEGESGETNGKENSEYSA